MTERERPEQWLIDECRSDPVAAAEEIERLNGVIEELQALTKRSQPATVSAPKSSAWRGEAKPVCEET